MEFVLRPQSPHQSGPHGCLSSINVPIHHSISISRVSCLCICPFTILPIPLCLHLHVLHLSIAHPYPHLFVISAQPCSSSVHPSTRPCGAFSPALSGWRLHPSFSPSLHFSPSAILFRPLITPSRPPPPAPPGLSTCIFISSLPERQFIVSRQRTRLSLPSVIVCVFIPSIYFSPPPPPTGAFQHPPVSAAGVTLCSPLTTPVMCWFHQLTVAVTVCDARSHYCISAPPSINESLSGVASNSRRVSPHRI